MPTAAKAVVTDYIRAGWVFVAAELRRDAGGVSYPHPIALTFPAKEPVYPMRLTGQSGGPVALDLYVIADGEAKCEGLETEFCDAFVGPDVQIRTVVGARGQGTGRGEAVPEPD